MNTELINNIKSFAWKKFQLNSEETENILKRNVSTKELFETDGFYMDITECVPISVYDENEIYKMNDETHDSFIKEFFVETDKKGLLNWCTSIQGKVLLGCYMVHYNLLEV